MLVAIAIPVFTTQLEKSKESTDMANLRSAYGEATANYLTDGKTGTSEKYKIQQTTAGWTVDSSGFANVLSAGEIQKVSSKTTGYFTVTVNSAGATVTHSAS